VRVLDCKDRVVFEGSEVRSRTGRPFQVFSAFRRVGLDRLWSEGPASTGLRRLPKPIPGISAGRLPSLAQLGAAGDEAQVPTAGERAARRRLDRFLESAIGRYARDRDLPAIDGTSRLSPYLRLGALSVRACVAAAWDVARSDPPQAEGANRWLDELIWREFYSAILEDHPRVLRRSFRPEYDSIRWNEDEAGFRAWCEGRTGYPFVDAAMRQLVEEGWMHNRARMVVASFLCKDLLVDWRWGERFFMQRLVDGDPASNNGGWQWSASTGTDAQPYFRIFNPVAQGQRFDPDGRYVRRFVPELRDVPDRDLHRPWEASRPPPDYPAPVVDHRQRRQLALERFKAARSGQVSA
jgi:deoxyribodipyrimidine photo-lyase